MTDKVVNLQISSCKQCPFMRADRHYTADSFEMCFDWKCTKSAGAIIACLDWNDKEPPVPAWCPLPVGAAIGGAK